MGVVALNSSLGVKTMRRMSPQHHQQPPSPVVTRSASMTGEKKDTPHRQFAMLFSIILMGIFTVLTTLGILGLIKTEYGWKMLTMDIEEEEYKNELNDAIQKISSNEAKLYNALQTELLKTSILYIVSWLGVMNCFTNLLLIYGIVIRSYAHVLPWAVVSFLTVAIVCVTTTLIMGNQGFVFGKYYTVAHFLLVFLMYCGMSITIFQYIKQLEKSYRRFLKPTTVKAYGGCIHTLNVNKMSTMQPPPLDTNTLNKQKLVV